MWLGHGVSGFLSRQMEFDADRYEARMVGGPVFRDTMEKVGELSLASQGAYADLWSSWRELRLPDDLPRLVLANVPQIPPPVLQAFRTMNAERRTRIFDTHPADRDRIAAALAEQPGTGLFTLDGPTTGLFADFDALSRTATIDHYQGVLDTRIVPASFIRWRRPWQARPWRRRAPPR